MSWMFDDASRSMALVEEGAAAAAAAGPPDARPRPSWCKCAALACAAFALSAMIFFRPKELASETAVVIGSLFLTILVMGAYQFAR